MIYEQVALTKVVLTRNLDQIYLSRQLKADEFNHSIHCSTRSQDAEIDRSEHSAYHDVIQPNLGLRESWKKTSRYCKNGKVLH